jgi:hypothetical protein
LEGRKGKVIFLIFMFGSIFNEGERRGGEEILSNFCFPQIGGIWRGGEVSSFNFY